MGNLDKEVVRLRMKPLKNGGISLYLDIYVEGVRRYEFLRLYLKEELTAADRHENQRTLQLANAIKGKRLVEIQNNHFGFTNTKVAQNADFIAYMKKNVRCGGHGNGTKEMVNNVAKKLYEYSRRRVIPFKMIDKQFCLGFIDFLKNCRSKGRLNKQFKVAIPLADKSIYSYYSIFSSNLRRAYKDEIISENPLSRIHSDDIPKNPKTERGFLTEEEVKTLYATPCKHDFVKTIFLFGCTTGLRLSDIVSLCWENLTYYKDGSIVCKKKQVKTGNIVEFPMSDAAKKLLPPRYNGSTGLIWGWKLHKGTVEHCIQKWLVSAGITRRITFHCSRHTFATLMLTKGADLYVVSKLLGHSDISSTQIYAKVVDQRKKEAIDLMPDFKS